jgi:Zn-dependent peptidase ImmA (M78 family)/transcriptional regulator with XRE-family HTH domain
MRFSQEDLGRRIARARERAGLTQAQLAEAVGLSQSAISRIESGERSVDSLELAAIAQRLGVSILDLLEERPLPNELLVLAGRVQSARAPGAVDHARRRVADLVHFHRLLTDLGVPSGAAPEIPRIPVPRAGLAVDQGAKMAHLARRHLDLGDDPLPDLVELLEDRFGIDVAIEPLPEGVEGLSLRLEDLCLVLVRSQPVVGRERFTLAHEVGHLLAGDAQPFHLDEDLFGHGLQEMRANAFAAHFLMPPPGLERRIRGRPVDGQVVCELQYAFGVSLEALLWHLRNLNLITEAQRMELQAAGPKALALRYGYLADWRASYRSEPEWRPPARLFRRGIEAYQRGLIGAERLASLLGMEEVEGFRRELEEAGIAPAWPEDTAPA